MPLPGQGKRIQQLVLDLSAAMGKRVSLADFGELVGKAEKGRGRAYSKNAVSEWIQERNEPTFAAVVAMSAVSRKHAPPGRSFTWIAVGSEEEVPMLQPITARTEQEKAEARKPSRRRRPA